MRPPTTVLTVRILQDQADALKRMSAAGSSSSSIVRTLLKLYLAGKIPTATGLIQMEARLAQQANNNTRFSKQSDNAA